MPAPVDAAPAGPVTYPDTGLGRGWEATALMVSALLLLSFGLVTLYSASGVLAQRQGLPDWYYVLRQATGAAAGIGLMLAASRVPYRWWRLTAWPLLLAVWVLLVLVVLPWTEGIAPVINGSRRWIDLGVTFQPSEVAKVAVVVWTAALAVKKQECFRSLTRGLLPFLLIWGAVVVPVLLEPDLSTACLLLLLGGLVVFTAGGRIAHFLVLGMLGAPVVGAQLDVGFRAQRMASFLEPGADPTGAGFQVHQSLVALGSGGVTGVGFGQGRQKFGFLPEPHNDFIFSLIGEEWGLVGVLFVVALYVTVVLVGFRIARRAPDLFGQLLAVGFTNLIAIQAVLHMGVGLGLIPPTGLALPLISYGRSNLLVTLLAFGILMSVARAAPGGSAGRVRSA
ncbi:MAG: putative peptidoglycan glycosyltransferase FtsW [Longimicrobiales bacterium]|nr:putative peptidoglycan glycosyltransferase FtsW [Longimicrobiales bacterium]